MIIKNELWLQREEIPQGVSIDECIASFVKDGYKAEVNSNQLHFTKEQIVSYNPMN